MSPPNFLFTKNTIPTVESALFSGNNFYSSAVYSCPQTFSQRDRIRFLCSTEFTAELFNLNTSRIGRKINVNYDKCINLVVKKRDGRVFDIIPENVPMFKNYDYVCCVSCRTTVGCIYLGTVALVKTIADDYYARLLDAPLVNITEEETNAGTFSRGLLFTQDRRMDRLPETMSVYDFNDAVNSHRATGYRRENMLAALPVLEAMRNTNYVAEFHTRDTKDFVFVSIL